MTKVSFRASPLEFLIRRYGRSRDEQTTINPNLAKTKADILDAYTSLLADDGEDPSKVTVSRLADKAGYSRTTFYQHFFDIQDVHQTLEEILLYGIEMNSKFYGTLFKSRDVPDSFLNFYDVLNRYGKYILTLMNHDKTFVYKYKEHFTSVFSREFFQGEQNDDILRAYASWICAAALGEGFIFWLKNQDKLPGHVARKIGFALVDGVYKQVHGISLEEGEVSKAPDSPDESEHPEQNIT